MGMSCRSCSKGSRNNIACCHRNMRGMNCNRNSSQYVVRRVRIGANVAVLYRFGECGKERSPRHSLGDGDRDIAFVKLLPEATLWEPTMVAEVTW